MLIRIPFALMVATLCLVALPSSADVITASNFPAGQTSTNGWEDIALNLPWYNGYTNSAWGQSFIANASGLLTTMDTLITAGFTHQIPGSPPLTVSFSESASGIPTINL